MKTIKSDNMCEGAKIFDISSIGNEFIIIKVTNVQDAEKVKQALTTKYATDIQIMPTVVFKPSVKISRIMILMQALSRQPEEIKDQICNQNTWIDIAEFNIVDCYLTKLQDQEFMTVIGECSYNMHAKFMKRQFIIFGLKKSLVHEHIRLLQCGKCWRFGQIGQRCNNDIIICRKCTQDHLTSACTMYIYRTEK